MNGDEGSVDRLDKSKLGEHVEVTVATDGAELIDEVVTFGVKPMFWFTFVFASISLAPRPDSRRVTVTL